MGFQKIPFGSFTTGMVSTDDFTGASLEGRSDTKLYQSAARTMYNFLPLVTGAAMYRPGFRYIDTNPHFLRIVPYELSPGLTYIFAFKHNGQMDVYRLDSGIPVLVAPNIGHPFGPSQLARLRWCQWGPIWIGFSFDVPPLQIVRNGSDASWTVMSVPFSPVIQWDFGSGMEDAWSASRGYPTCGTIHQDRLVMGGTPSLPGAVFGSVIGQYSNFTENTPLQPDDAFAFTLASDANEIVLDLQSFNDTLMINTASSEWIERSQPLNSSTVNFQKTTQHGMLVTGVRPENVDSGNAFVDKRSTMRISTYSNDAQAYEAEDMNTLTPGLLLNPTASAFIRKFLNSSNLFVYRQTGTITPGGNTLAVLTYDKKAAVAGWSLMVAGAGFGFLEVCAVNDQLYALMWDGLGTIWLVHLTPEIYLDLWSTQVSGAPTTSWTGLGHLAGKTVTVIDNTGGVINGLVVGGGGTLTTPNPATQIWVGIPYNGVLETMPVCPIEDGQIMRGEPVRKVFADIILRRTTGLVVDDQIVTLDKFGPNLLDQFTPPVNTTIRVLLDGVDTEPTVRITNHGPWPCQVLGIGVGVKYRTPPR
jgi:hypothetical protein